MVLVNLQDLFGNFIMNKGALKLKYSNSLVVSRILFDIFTLSKLGFLCYMVLNTIKHIGEFYWDLLRRKNIFVKLFLVSAI
jgi:hypothetical protein